MWRGFSHEVRGDPRPGSRPGASFCVSTGQGRYGKTPLVDVTNSRRRHLWLGVLLWVVFGTGLLVQALAPRLTITNNAFVLPSLSSEEQEVRVDEIVKRARRMQW